jgi:hypothetical protein
LRVAVVPPKKLVHDRMTMIRVARWSWVWVALLGCGGDSGRPAEEPDEGESILDVTPVCKDADLDGYGENCDAGEDCDDKDDTVFEECGSCTETREGCSCDEGTAPVECKIPTAEVSESNILCKTGKRYCRDGAWTACLGVAGYSK